MKKTKGKKAKPFKLEYLRQIDKNLMLHATQPHEREFGLYEAPPVILMRVIHILETMTASYRNALKLVVAAEKAKSSKSNPLAGTIAFLEKIVEGMSGVPKRALRKCIDTSKKALKK